MLYCADYRTMGIINKILFVNTKEKQIKRNTSMGQNHLLEPT